MFRRIVSIVVVLGLLAGNLAAVPHAHSGMTAAEHEAHDATPHFHLPTACGGLSGHSHGPGHAHQHFHGDRTPSASANVPVIASLAAIDHDSNAIYTPDSVGRNSNVDTAAAVPSRLLASPSFEWAISGDAAHASRWQKAPQEESRGDTAPLYLVLRTLRI